MTRRSAASMLALVLLTAACAPYRADRGLDRTITLSIDNRELADMRIYLVREGTRILIGTVNGFTSRIFAVPAFMLGGSAQLGLLATPFAGTDELLSPIVTIDGHQQVSWRVERASHGASILVR